ncbi:MAG: CdaR family protein [Clostridiales bacterium]|nr:CdaR family protein [Clostridiales bacterium]
MLKSNKINLLISIVVAIGFWMWVTVAVNPPTDFTVRAVPVEITNLTALNDRGLTIDQTQPQSVDVVVNGPRSEVTKLTSADFHATADVTGFPKGEVAVNVSVVVPSGMQLVQIRPENTIRLNVVDLITVTKSVRVEFADTFPPGTEPGFITVMPSEMEVAGTVSSVDNIAYIRAEVPAGVLTDEAQEFSLEPAPITKSGDVDNTVSLSQNTIQVTARICTVKEVPLLVDKVGDPPDNVEVTNLTVPDRIWIRGTKDAIAGITEVHTKPIDLSTMTETTDIPINPLLPDGVEVADRSKNLTVNIEVQGIARKVFEFTADEIKVQNLAQGLSGHVNTGSITLTLLAPESQIADIQKSDITVFADGSNISEPGKAIETTLSYSCDKPYKSITLDPPSVRVTVNDEGRSPLTNPATYNMNDMNNANNAGSSNNASSTDGANNAGQ